MKTNNNLIRSIILIAFLTLGISFTISAQPPGPPVPPVGVPLDGGLSIFLGAGLLAGSKVLFDKHRKNQTK